MTFFLNRQTSIYFFQPDTSSWFAIFPFRDLLDVLSMNFSSSLLLCSNLPLYRCVCIIDIFLSRYPIEFSLRSFILTAIYAPYTYKNKVFYTPRTLCIKCPREVGVYKQQMYYFFSRALPLNWDIFRETDVGWLQDNANFLSSFLFWIWKRI